MEDGNHAIPHSAFRTPHSAFRIPHSALGRVAFPNPFDPGMIHGLDRSAMSLLTELVDVWGARLQGCRTSGARGAGCAWLELFCRTPQAP
jgi:hypothetical protein